MVKTAIQNSPHLRGKNSTFKMMMEFLIVVSILWVCSIIYYFVGDFANYYSVQYGLKAIGMGVSCVLFAFITDAIFYLPIFWKDEKRLKLAKGETRVKTYFKKLIFNYSYVTGLLVALLFPIGTPVYVLFVCTFISVFIFKNLFGGFGANIFNPAIIGRVIGQIAFTGQLKTYLGENAPTSEFLNSGASLTSQFAGTSNSIGYGFSQISTLNLFIGNYVGTLGETFAIVIIILAVYLMVRKIIDWRVVLSFVVTFYLTYFLINLCSGKGVNSFENAFRQLCVGGALFGAVFCLTDPVTSPVNRTGKIIFATGSALITIVIRIFASAPEGMAYSILVMNMLVPMIDYFTSERTNKHMWKKYTAISIIPAASIILGCSYGGVNYVAPVKPVTPTGDVVLSKIKVSNSYADFGHYELNVTVGTDFKVYQIEILTHSYTLEDSWIQGGNHSHAAGSTDFTEFVNTYIPTSDKAISFATYDNCSLSDINKIQTNSTEATYGLVLAVQKAINEYKAEYTKITVDHQGTQIFDSFSGNVYIKDDKVYYTEITDASIEMDCTIDEFLNGGSHTTDINVDSTEFSNRYVNHGDGIPFSVFEGTKVTVAGATITSSGYIDFVNEAIQQYKASK